MDSWRIVRGTELFKGNRRSVELRKSALPALQVGLLSPKSKEETSPRRGIAGKRLGSVTLRRKGEINYAKRMQSPKQIEFSYARLSDTRNPPAKGTLTAKVLARKNLSPVLELLSAENTGRNTPVVVPKSPEISIQPHTARTFIQYNFSPSPIQVRLEASLMPYLLPRKRTAPLRRHSEVPHMPLLVPR